MKQLKVNANEFDGYGVTVTIEGGLDTYAKSFLHIFNNVRESRELFLVENNYNNDVTVYCDTESKEALIEYLENFGTIKRIENVLMYQLQDTVNYDYDKHDNAIVVPYFE